MIDSIYVWEGDFPLMYAREIDELVASEDLDVEIVDAQTDPVGPDSAIFDDGLFSDKTVIFQGVGKPTSYMDGTKDSKRALIDKIPKSDETRLSIILGQLHDLNQRVFVYISVPTEKTLESVYPKIEELDDSEDFLNVYNHVIPHTGREFFGQLQGDAKKFQSFSKSWLKDQDVSIEPKAIQIVLSAAQDDRKALSELLLALRASYQGESVSVEDAKSQVKMFQKGRSSIFSLIGAISKGNFKLAMEDYERIDWTEPGWNEVGKAIYYTQEMAKRIRIYAECLEGKPDQDVLTALGVGNPYYILKEVKSPGITSASLAKGFVFVDETYRKLTSPAEGGFRVSFDGTIKDETAARPRDEVLLLITNLCRTFAP